MNKDEILRYITLCVSYKHNNDISPHITKSAEKKEDLLFESAIEFLEKLDKENKELKEKLNKATEILKVVLNKWKEERWILQSEKEVKMIENVMKEAEAFLKED